MQSLGNYLSLETINEVRMIGEEPKLKIEIMKHTSEFTSRGFIVSEVEPGVDAMDRNRLYLVKKNVIGVGLTFSENPKHSDPGVIVDVFVSKKEAKALTEKTNEIIALLSQYRNLYALGGKAPKFEDHRSGRQPNMRSGVVSAVWVVPYNEFDINLLNKLLDLMGGVSDASAARADKMTSTPLKSVSLTATEVEFLMDILSKRNSRDKTVISLKSKLS